MKNQVTGRINSLPHEKYTKSVLNNQFLFEVENYLKHYITIEKLLVQHGALLELFSKKEMNQLFFALDNVDQGQLRNISQENFTDMAFSIEKAVEINLNKVVPRWHLDRSRNDFQACAQIMYGREQWIMLMNRVFRLFDIVISKAKEYERVIMPGYTHYQPAQTITVSFYLTAISQHILKSLKKMLYVLQSVNESCPLGSGAMSGQELLWDCDKIAEQLGFDQFIGHALTGVSSRTWIIEMGETITFFVHNMSRYLTDLLNWGSNEYRFIDFPDELVGISSSMPQKRNFPILERARGKTSHIISYYFDFILGQKNTSFSNTVEVSKEASKNIDLLFEDTNELIDILELVYQNIIFDSDRLMRLCEKDFFGGFSLANYITLKNDIPYRKSQIIAGEFIKRSIEKNNNPSKLSIYLLEEVCQKYGYTNRLTSKELISLFNIDLEVSRKNTKGSTNPKAVKEILSIQMKSKTCLLKQFNYKKGKINDALDDINILGRRG